MEAVEKPIQISKLPSLVEKVVGLFQRLNQTKPAIIENPEDPSPPIIASPSQQEVKSTLFSPTPTTPGREERRAIKLAAHEALKQEKSEDHQSTSVTDAPELKVESASVTKQPKLPSGFKEVKKADTTLQVTPDEIPWLRKDAAVNLVLITMKDSMNSQLYFGSAIRGKVLVGAANNMSEHQKNITDNLLYAHLPDIAETKVIRFAQRLVNAITDRPIFYFANKGGQRVYFIRLADIDNVPLIVRIGVCDKTDQAEVLTILTTKDYKDIKRFGKV